MFDAFKTKLFTLTCVGETFDNDEVCDELYPYKWLLIFVDDAEDILEADEEDDEDDDEFDECGDSSFKFSKVFAEFYLKKTI